MDSKTIKRAVKRAKAPPKPAAPDVHLVVADALANLASSQKELAESMRARDEGAIELLQESLKDRAPEVKVELNAGEIGRVVGKAVGDALASAPQRPHVSYYATIDRNRKGEMVGARIDPIGDE